MPENISNRSDILPRINRGEAWRRIREARTFLRKNTDFYQAAPGFEQKSEHIKSLRKEASRLEKSIDQAAKSLIAQGNKVPSVLVEINSLLEELGLILDAGLISNRPGMFYTYDKVLAQGDFEKSHCNEEKNIKLEKWWAVRSELVHRNIDYAQAQLKEIENRRQLPIAESCPVTITDAIHLQYSLLDPKQKPQELKNLDLGWVVLNSFAETLDKIYKNGDLEILKRVEGGIRRIYRLSEQMKKLRDVLMRNRGEITLISEIRGDNGLHRGRMPDFNHGKIKFGDDLDIREKIDEAIETKLIANIREQIEENYEFLIDSVLRGFRKEFRDKFDREIVRGGREGDYTAKRFYGAKVTKSLPKKHLHRRRR